MGRFRPLLTRDRRIVLSGARFEELAWSETPSGVISLRRRFDPGLDTDVLEVKLGDEFLMSSLFTVAEVELARLALAEASGGELEVVVGGLGLGYTAGAVLEDERVASLVVIEAIDDVIDWHARGLVPDAAGLGTDPRARLVHGDFFAMARSEEGFDPQRPGRRFDAVLVDIDHTPRNVLHPSHAAFYSAAGLRDLTRHLSADGVFALWSDDPPDVAFLTLLERVFAASEAHEVAFHNPYTGDESSNTVYVARM